MDPNAELTQGLPADPAWVLIVDGANDCTHLTEILSRGGYGSRCVAEPNDALALVREQRPAAVLVEVALDPTTGYELCRALRAEHGDDLPIVFVGGARTEPSDRVLGFLSGADDYLVKPVDPDELIARLGRLIARVAPRAGERSGADAFEELTRRESEVLRLLAHGLNQETIARDLQISPATVGTHIQRILTKLNVHSRAQAVALAYKEKLVQQGR